MKFVTSRINKKKTPYGAMSVCLLSREKLLKDFSVYKTVFVTKCVTHIRLLRKKNLVYHKII